MAKSGSYDDKVASRGTYKANITAIIDQAKTTGVKPVMLTATVIQGKDAWHEWHLIKRPFDIFRVAGFV